MTKARRRAEDVASRLDAFLDGRVSGPRRRSQRRRRAIRTRSIWRADGQDPDPLGRRPPADDLDGAAAGRSIRSTPATSSCAGTSTCSARRPPEAFAEWAGVSTRGRTSTFAGLGPALMPVSAPIGDGWILAADEADVPRAGSPGAPARLLPSGDTFFLLQGADRELLVPDADRRAMLWTPRVWPGALLVDGEVVGTWRRAQAVVTVEPWQVLTATQKDAIEAEAASMPLPGLPGPIRLRWAADGT